MLRVKRKMGVEPEIEVFPVLAVMNLVDGQRTRDHGSRGRGRIEVDRPLPFVKMGQATADVGGYETALTPFPGGGFPLSYGS